MATVMKRFVVKVDAGRVFATPGALNCVHEDDLFDSFVRHISGDWGDVSEEDRKANDEAIDFGSRILSSYADRHGIRFWIITEADRSATTILLPEDY